MCSLILLLTPFQASAQASNAAALSGGPIVTPYGPPAANAPIRVCLPSSVGSPCATTGVSLFADPNLTQPLPNPTTLNSQGYYSVFASAPGMYEVQIQVSGSAAPYTYYVWTGTAALSPTIIQVNGVGTAPVSPVNFQNSSTITWTLSGNQISAAATGGGGGCAQGTCIVNNPTANQVVVQPAKTNLDVNNFEGQLYADQYGTGSNGIETAYAQCLLQNGTGPSGCSIKVSPLYGNADVPAGWQQNASFYATDPMQLPAGGSVLDARNGVQYWNFHDPVNPFNRQTGGLQLNTLYDLNTAQANAVAPGYAPEGMFNQVVATQGGNEYNYYPFGMPQYLPETSFHGDQTQMNLFTGGISFLHYGQFAGHANGDKILFWDQLIADGGIFSGNSEGNKVADHTVEEDPAVFTGTVNGTPATGATVISVNATIGAQTQGDGNRWLVNTTPLYSGAHFTNSIGPQTTGSAGNSAIMPPQVSDSTQNFTVSTIVQVCYPGSDNGAGGASGCTAGAQPVGYVPAQNYALTISAYSISGGVITLTTGPQKLVAGQQVELYGFSGTAAFLNTTTLTVLAAGLTGTQFEATTTLPAGSGTASGFATYSPTGVSPAQSITFNVVAPYTGTGGNTNGLPAGFCSSSTAQSSNSSGACYIPATGVGCITDQLETECENYTYNSAAQTITVTNLQYPHVNGAMFAVGGLAGDAVEDLSTLASHFTAGTSGNIDETYPIAASLNATTFYYVTQRTNEGYGSPTLGGSTDGGSGNGGTAANGTNGATYSALCFSTGMYGFSNASGTVTFSMNQPPETINPFVLYNGLTATITTNGSSSYNGNWPLTFVSSNGTSGVFTYTPSPAPSGTLPTSGTVSYCNANYNVLAAARVLGVTNPSTGAVDGTFQLYPNTTNFSGATVREPHYQKMFTNGTFENVTQFQPKDYYGSTGDGITYCCTVSGPGWGLDISNASPFSAYLGAGGSLSLPTNALVLGGAWANDMTVTTAPTQGIIRVNNPNLYGYSSAASAFPVVNMALTLPSAFPGYGSDTFSYDPSYNLANRGQALTSGAWIFCNGTPFNVGPANGNCVSTVRTGHLTADLDATIPIVNVGSIQTTQLTNTPANAPFVVGSGTANYDIWIVAHDASGTGATIPYFVGGCQSGGVTYSVCNAPNTLSSSAYIGVCAFLNPGVTSYDFLVNSTTQSFAVNVPVGNGATFNTGPNYTCATYTGQALSAYTPVTANTTGTVKVSGNILSAGGYTQSGTATNTFTGPATFGSLITADNGVSVTGGTSGIKTPALIGTAPVTYVADAGAGSGATTPVCATGVNCTALSGTITLTTGTSPATGSGFVTVTFTNPLPYVPTCQVRGMLAAAAATQPFVNSATTSNFVFNVATAPAASTALTYTYICVN